MFGQIPKYQIHRLQRMQNTTAGYVYGRYTAIKDVIDLNWLPVKENIGYNTIKLVHKSLHCKLWPKYLNVELREPARNLRSSDLGAKILQGGTNTFQQQATIYNELPPNIRRIEEFSVFNKEVRGYLKDRALRALSL